MEVDYHRTTAEMDAAYERLKLVARDVLGSADPASSERSTEFRAAREQFEQASKQWRAAFHNAKDAQGRPASGRNWAHTA